MENVKGERHHRIRIRIVAADHENGRQRTQPADKEDEVHQHRFLNNQRNRN